MTTEIAPEDWIRIRRVFLRYGFSMDEATWAADNNLDPLGEKGSQIKQLLRNRRTKLRTLMKISGFDRKTVIESLDQMRRENAERKGYDAMDLFQGESP